MVVETRLSRRGIGSYWRASRRIRAHLSFEVVYAEVFFTSSRCAIALPRWMLPMATPPIGTPTRRPHLFARSKRQRRLLGRAFHFDRWAES